jgi:hypothetical protein
VKLIIPDDPRVGIGLNTVPEPGGLKKKVMFMDFYPPETVATTSTATDSKFECIDDDALVRFNPLYIGTTPEMSSKKRFDEEKGLIGSNTVKTKLFLDHMVPEAAVGQFTGDELGNFESTTATPEALNGYVEHGDRFASHQNRPPIGFGHYASESTPRKYTNST